MANKKQEEPTGGELFYALVGDGFEVFGPRSSEVQQAAKTVNAEATPFGEGQLTFNVPSSAWSKVKEKLEKANFVLSPMS